MRPSRTATSAMRNGPPVPSATVPERITRSKVRSCSAAITDLVPRRCWTPPIPPRGGPLRQAGRMADRPELAELLDLAPHLEGGWYRETWRAELELPATALPAAYDSPRSAGTAIHFLLGAGES